MRLRMILCMFVACFLFGAVSTAEMAMKYGDVNRDGKVTMTDANILLQYCQGRRSANSLDLTAADVNGDGKVNVLDVAMIKEYIIGRISSFPAEKTNVSTNKPQGNPPARPQTNVQTVPSGAVVSKSDGWYRISPMHALGKALDVGGAKMEAGANLQLWDYGGVPQQKFYLEHRGNGYYTMRAGHSNLYVDAQGGVAHNGENVQQFTYNGSAAQLWRLIDAGNGAVYIETKMKPGLSFDCANRQGSNGTNVQLWERGNVDWNKWKLTPVDAPPPPTVYPKDGWYRIATAYNNNLGLDIGGARTDSTANVQLWSYTGAPQQKFYLQARGNGYYSIKSGNCDMYVDVAGGISENGTNVWQYSYNGTGTQLWKFLDAGDGTMWIESKVKPDLVIDARTSQAGNGGNVQVWARQNVAWHKWKLIEVPKPVLSNSAVSSSSSALESQVSKRLENIIGEWRGKRFSGAFHGAIECKGFASMVFDRLFNVGYIGSGQVYDASKNAGTNYIVDNLSNKVRQVGSSIFDPSIQTLENLLNQARPGDFLQVKRRNPSQSGTHKGQYAPHSMIVVSVNKNARNITVFDANSDGNNTVKSYTLNYETFKNKNIGVSLYTPKEYK